MELAVEVFALLADATRVRIVLALRDEDELLVNRSAEIVDRPGPAVSPHLAKMRMARMVRSRQDGQRVSRSSTASISVITSTATAPTIPAAVICGDVSGSCARLPS